MKKNLLHRTVLLKETIQNLLINNNGIYIDCTFGHGGHSNRILSRLTEKGKLYAIDRDPNSIKIAMKINDSRFKILHDSFSKIKKYAKKFSLVNKVDGILLDLGVSTSQILDPKRGFSFIKNGPLDMRMNPNLGISASDWIKKATLENIIFVLKNFGEEKFAKKIAKEIIFYKKKIPITTTKQLVEIISRVVPRKKKHPATKTFQAIRIFINNELEEIKQVLKDGLKILRPQGRLLVICFHSLENRIIKKFIYKNSNIPNVLTQIPITELEIKKFFKYNLKNLGKILPNKCEIKKNIRSRSAILRIIEKIN